MKNNESSIANLQHIAESQLSREQFHKQCLELSKEYKDKRQKQEFLRYAEYCPKEYIMDNVKVGPNVCIQDPRVKCFIRRWKPEQLFDMFNHSEVSRDRNDEYIYIGGRSTYVVENGMIFIDTYEEQDREHITDAHSWTLRELRKKGYVPDSIWNIFKEDI